MGNCQAAEAATVVIQHPGNNKVERIYWSISAHQVMSSNPGHYVALLITSPPTTARTENGLPVKHLKLLRPDDTLIMGQVYRLVSFEGILSTTFHILINFSKMIFIILSVFLKWFFFTDVLKEFAAKKSVKLGKLIRECGGGLALDTNKTISSQIHQNSKPILVNAKVINSSSPFMFLQVYEVEAIL